MSGSPKASDHRRHWEIGDESCEGGLESENSDEEQRTEDNEGSLVTKESEAAGRDIKRSDRAMEAMSLSEFWSYVQDAMARLRREA